MVLSLSLIGLVFSTVTGTISKGILYKNIHSPVNALILKDQEGLERIKRTIARSAIVNIVKTARLVFSRGKLRMFEKSGGYEQAKKDFFKFRPTKLENIGNIKTGISGKKSVILNFQENPGFIEVGYYKRLEDGRIKRIRTDIIKYTS